MESLTFLKRKKIYKDKEKEYIRKREEKYIVL